MPYRLTAFSTSCGAIDRVDNARLVPRTAQRVTVDLVHQIDAFAADPNGVLIIYRHQLGLRSILKFAAASFAVPK
jgi:hypothetical protein